MGLKELAAELVSIGLMPLQKHPAFGAELDAYGTNPKIGQRFVEGAICIWEGVTEVQHRHWRVTKNATSLTDVGRDVTKKRTKSRLGNSPEELQVRKMIEGNQRYILSQVKLLAKELSEGVTMQRKRPYRVDTATKDRSMQAYDAGILTDDAMGPLEGGESAAGNFPGKIYL